MGLSGGAKRDATAAAAAAARCSSTGCRRSPARRSPSSARAGRSETSEGIAADERFPPLVESYAKHDTAQCGYCTPGQFTVAKYIIEKYGEPTGGADPRGAGRQHLPLRHHSRHVKAIQEAASAMKGGQLWEALRIHPVRRQRRPHRLQVRGHLGPSGPPVLGHDLGRCEVSY